MRITAEEVRHIATLARVRMSAEEIELMRDQMSNILDHIDMLKQVDTEGIEPTGHSAGVETVMRDDEVAASISVEQVLANVPRREGDYIRVRAVLE